MTTLLVNTGRGRYAPVTLLPMLFVISTTMTAGVQMVRLAVPGDDAARASRCEGVSEPGDDGVRDGDGGDAAAAGGGRWVAVLGGLVPGRPDPGPGDELGTERSSQAPLPNGGTGGDGIQALGGVQMEEDGDAGGRERRLDEDERGNM